MNPLKIVKDIFRSVSSLSYWTELLAEPFDYTVKFFMTLIGLAAVSVSLAIVVMVHQNIGQNAPEFFQGFSQVFPEELEITITDGLVTTNVDEPYAIPVSRSPELSSLIKSMEEPSNRHLSEIENLLVIETQGSVEEFEAHNTFALLTSRSLSIVNDNQNIETISLGEVDDMVINQELLKGFINSLLPLLVYAYPLIVLGVMLAFLIFVPSIIILATAWFALATYIVSRLTGIQLSYGKAFQFTLHLLIPIILVSLILSQLNLNPSLPFQTTLVVGLLAGLILRRIRVGEATVTRTIPVENPLPDPDFYQSPHHSGKHPSSD